MMRCVASRDGSTSRSSVLFDQKVALDSGPAAFDLGWLRSRDRPKHSSRNGSVRAVDLFCGCGGLTLGIEESARALGKGLEILLASDIDTDALATYRLNWPSARTEEVPVQELVDGTFGDPLTAREKRLRIELGRVDVLVGGPPCQGHSDLNNHTRRADPKNELYFKMARFCEVLDPMHIVIENVPGVLHDSSQVAQRTWAALENLGYSVSTAVVDSSRIGVAQKRRRSITLASRAVTPDLGAALTRHEVEPRPVSWALGDLCGLDPSSSVWDSPPTPSPETRERIDYLFDRDLHDLPDSQRPDCHRLKSHSYKSVYGRMFWDRPAQTITTGFGGMGRGRYVHPLERRTITPHEAARIQFFPDFFLFAGDQRTKMQLQIGNAVPPKLGYVLGLELLS
jgi:DNA (cytosine-5)-methyltransferase 1